MIIINQKMILKATTRRGFYCYNYNFTFKYKIIFEFKCFNGEKVYVAYALDCHDRECLS